LGRIGASSIQAWKLNGHHTGKMLRFIGILVEEEVRVLSENCDDGFDGYASLSSLLTLAFYS
jgi:hypothetical protein